MHISERNSLQSLNKMHHAYIRKESLQSLNKMHTCIYSKGNHYNDRFDIPQGK
jgi:hypothetical protein